MKRVTSNKRAFTLIELLVVVLIIGILAAIAVPQYQVAVGKAKFMKLITLGDAIHKAEEMYFLEHGAYTNRLSDLALEVSTEGLGHLSLVASASDAVLSVSLANFAPYYVMYWDHHPIERLRGQRECRVSNTKLTNVNKRICAGLTRGNEQPGDDYSLWKFPK